MLARLRREMFYEAQILCQRGQLGKVWIAAHWDKKLSKTTLSQVSSSNIVKDAGTWIWRDAQLEGRPLAVNM